MNRKWVTLLILALVAVLVYRYINRPCKSYTNQELYDICIEAGK